MKINLTSPGSGKWVLEFSQAELDQATAQVKVLADVAAESTDHIVHQLAIIERDGTTIKTEIQEVRNKLYKLRRSLMRQEAGNLEPANSTDRLPYWVSDVPASKASLGASCVSDT